MQKQLTLGMPVFTLDGQAGNLERVVADSENRAPSYLVVRRGPPLFPRDIVVPVSLVTEVSAQGIRLNTTQDALSTFPDYELTIEKPLEKPLTTPKEPSYTDRWPGILPLPSIWRDQGKVRLRERNVPERTVDLRRGMTVYSPEGEKLGEVAGLVAEAESKEASHLVLRRSHLFQDEQRLIPLDLVDFTIRDDVYLSIGEAQVMGLPPYRPESR